MDSKMFGSMALQLLEAANIPGGSLDAAVMFRDCATALQSGSVRLVEVNPETPAETPNHSEG